jgi:hypothetical protein
LGRVDDGSGLDVSVGVPRACRSRRCDMSNRLRVVEQSDLRAIARGFLPASGDTVIEAVADPESSTARC